MSHSRETESACLDWKIQIPPLSPESYDLEILSAFLTFSNTRRIAFKVMEILNCLALPTYPLSVRISASSQDTLADMKQEMIFLILANNERCIRID